MTSSPPTSIKRKGTSSPSSSLTTPQQQAGQIKTASTTHEMATMSPATPANGDGDGFERVLTKEERRKRKKVEKHRPQFHFDMSAFKNGRKIGIAHIRDLSLYIVADAPKPNWIFAENHSHMTHTVVLLVPGILPDHLGLPPISPISALPFATSPSAYASSSSDPLPPCRVPSIGKMFTYGLPTRAPGDQRRMFSVLNTLVSSPLPEGLRKQKEAESRRLASLAKTDGTPPFPFLLTPNQMIDNDYRLPSYISPSDRPVIPGLRMDDLPEELAELLKAGPGAGGDVNGEGPIETATNASNFGSKRVVSSHTEKGWLETPEAKEPPPEGKYPILAIDCEMVLTEKGQELARISVVDFRTGKNIYDELVTPSAPVVDYRTQWSGITASRLAQAKHSLSSIQRDLLQSADPILTPHTILLGHSLECDLTALKIRHPLCIDTALIYRHPRGAPYKPGLKWLAQKWLDREIQASSKGHDSEEDARTCVDLLKLKLAHGPEFGLFTDNNEPIFDRISRQISGGGGGTATGAAEKRGKRTVVCDTSNARAGYGSKATTAIKCETDDGVVDAILEQVEGHDFVFGRLMDLASAQGWNGPANAPAEPLPIPSSSPPSTAPASTSAPTASNPQTPDIHHPDSNASSATTPSSPITTALTNLDTQLTRLHASLPRNTAFILLTGHSDPMEMKRLNEKRQKWERLVKTLGGIDGVPKEDRWLAEDDRKLEGAVVDAREGMAFFCVK